MDKKIGCLIIHGFGGSISEIQPLSDYLNNKGIITVCPTLKGHTGKRRDLAVARYHDWIESAEEGLRDLKTKCDFTVLVGFSMGGLIAANIALNNSVDGIVTLNTPIYYWDFRQIANNIKQDLKKREFRNLKSYAKACMDKPVNSLINFRKLLSTTKPLFREISHPLLVVQALEDDTVQHRSAHYIYHNTVSTDKDLKYYTGSGHMICHSPICDRVFDDVFDFIDNRYRRSIVD